MKAKQMLFDYACRVWMFINGMNKNTTVYKMTGVKTCKKGKIEGFKSTWFDGLYFRFFIKVRWDKGGCSHFRYKEFNNTVLIAVP